MGLPDIPLGHSISSHIVLGWCCNCSGKSVNDEVNAWRAWSMTHVAEVDEAVSRNGQR